MGRQNHSRDDRLRRRLAQEAARLIAEEGVRDFRSAKQKAAARLGIIGNGHMPRNLEIEEALAHHQRLFRAAIQPGVLFRLRRTASELMRLLAPFEPRLVGSLLRGTADEHSVIELHLFTDTPEDVVMFLLDQHIPYETGERQWPGNGGFPLFRFRTGDSPIELTVFPYDGLRHAPPCPVDGRPMRRATRDALLELLVT